jgi:pimeloyl-ACP methyl ester carboxylesterase
VIGALLAEQAPAVTVPPAPPTGAVAGEIWRDYVDTRYGQLLVRRAGELATGVPLVMLHASPGSAEMLVGLITRLMSGRQVCALDTLGNGDSDKPPWEVAEIGDYAPVVADATDALGLAQFDLYGSHTGGLIALETALLVPDRVRRLVLDGVTLHDAEETADFLAHYTPPLLPSADGTHLHFAWNWLRDQTLFWPWYNRTRESIRWVDPVDAEHLHVWFVELMKSGETYPIGYRAAFRYRTGERVPHLSTPALMVARSTDMLHSTTHAAAKLAPNARADTLPEADEDAARMIASFLDGADTQP